MKRLGAFFVSLAMSLAIADVAAQRILHVPSNYLSRIVRVDAALRPAKGLKPDLNAVVTGAFNEFTFRVRTDDRGFRKSAAAGSAESARADVVFLGDSQTVGVGVDDEDSYPSIFAKLSQRPVLNTACYGYNNYEELQALEKALVTERPTRVVMGFFSGNDPYENDRFARNASSSAPSRSRRQGLVASMKARLITQSFFYHTLMGLRKYDAVNGFLYRIGAVQSEPPKELVVFRAAGDEEQESFWRSTEEAILRAKDEASRAGAAFTVLFIPDRYQVDGEYWKAWVGKYRLDEADYDLRAPNRRIARFCEANGIDHLDATDALAQESRQRRVYWRIDNHLNRDGNAVIARVLTDHLRTGKGE